MASQSAKLQLSQNVQQPSLRKYLPFLNWMFRYRREQLSGDVVAGVIVAVMLVPQSMAYASLAGLPPQAGLYASIFPLLVYGLLGTSSALSVGPTATVSILTAAAIGSTGADTVGDMLAMGALLAVLIGIVQLMMGLLRAGFLVNFLSYPVLAGYTNAVAIVIALSQLKHVLGFTIPSTDYLHQTLFYAADHIYQTNLTVFTIALASIGVLFFFKLYLAQMLNRLNMPTAMIMPITKAGPIVVVILCIVLIALSRLDQRADVAIIGAVPAGFPPLTLPTLDIAVWRPLLPIALTISLIGYTESISVAKSLASRRRQKIDANQELVAMGLANIGSSLTGGYPISGGVARSAVNFAAGANTGLASIITASIILITVMFLTPLFYFLPNAVLAAIIIVAVSALLDYKSFLYIWRYSRAEGLAFLSTFGAVLLIGVESGLLVGVGVSLAFYLQSTSRPHIAVVGRLGDTEEYRNVLRHNTHTEPHILALRIDESLYFPNAQFLEEVVLAAIVDNADIEHFVLVCSAVNFIDTSALEVLTALADALNTNHISFNLAAVKGPVMDRLEEIGFVNRIGRERFFLNTHAAFQYLK